MSKIPLFLDNDMKKLVGYVRFSDIKIRKLVEKSIKNQTTLKLGGGIIKKKDGKLKLVQLSILTKEV